MLQFGECIVQMFAHPLIGVRLCPPHGFVLFSKGAIHGGDAKVWWCVVVVSCCECNRIVCRFLCTVFVSLVFL
jgi:hypothetical protein